MKLSKNIFWLLFSILFSVPSGPLRSHQFNACSKDHDDSLIADYVIIGVGTAGSVMAKKLTNDRKTSVIALHNGENLTQDPDIKLSKNALTTIFSALLGIPPFSLQGDTNQQPFADNNIFSWVMGLPLGGTSSVNAGAYCRGTNEVYAQWEAIAGPEWSVNRILDTYKELEHYHGETTDPAARGFHGPLSVRQNLFPTQVSHTFTNALITGTGVPFALDYNDPNTPIGASLQMQYTQSGKDGKYRVSGATAFLNKKVMTRDGFGIRGRNLRVLFNSMALKAIWKVKLPWASSSCRMVKINRFLLKKGSSFALAYLAAPFCCIQE